MVFVGSTHLRLRSCILFPWVFNKWRVVKSRRVPRIRQFQRFLYLESLADTLWKRCYLTTLEVTLPGKEEVHLPAHKVSRLNLQRSFRWRNENAALKCNMCWTGIYNTYVQHVSVSVYQFTVYVLELTRSC